MPDHTDSPAIVTLSPARILLKVLGPGILLAGAAIGVSHLVQATRAGAEFRFGLLPLLLIACATKYPFLEFGPRYAAATGRTLIDGYRDLGRWALWTTLAVTFGSMFIIMAGVTVVTAVLAASLFGAMGIELGVTAWSAVILGACLVLLLIGRYPTLDLTMKLVMALLLVSTIAAVVAAAASPSHGTTGEVRPPAWWKPVHFGFLLAFMGWMPIPIDSAIWHSIWTRERCKQTGYECTVRQARADFNFGYGLATVVAMIFLTLGALVMFGSGQAFASSGGAFIGQFIEIYTTTLGAWARPIISIAAFTTMFSTTLVVLDAFPRVMQRLVATLRDRAETPRLSGRHYAVWVVVQAALGLAIIVWLQGKLLTLVDLATTLSFLTAPILAYINYRVITGPTTPVHAQPRTAMRVFSVGSMVFLAVFSVAYVVWRVV
ncbi:MAG: NRAMP family divalent metal transporter [Phycisphaerales bacterium JB050]